MEAERLQSIWEGFSETVALISPSGKDEENISLVHRLISEASASYPQLSQLRFVHIPLPVSKLGSWVYRLAAEVIGQWRDLPVEGFSVAAVIDQLGLTIPENAASLLNSLDNADTNSPLSWEVTVRVQALHDQQQQQKLGHLHLRAWLDWKATELAKWFSQVPPEFPPPFQPVAESGGCLAQLQSNAVALRSKALHKLQEYFIRLCGAGPQTVLQWLRSLDEALAVIRADYETRRQECLRRERSAWQAYDNLSRKLGERRWALFGGPRTTNWEAALRALGTIYHFRLETEIYTLASQLVGELVRQTNMYATSIAQTDALLASLQGWFTEHCPVEPTLTPLLQDYLIERVNLLELRCELERWTDRPLHQWSALEPTQREALREQILARIQPVCLEVYAECCCSALALNTPNLQAKPVRMDQQPSGDPL